MYINLGIHWASSIPAFLALLCVPFPFLFYKHGESIRLKCKYAAEAARALEQIRGSANADEEERDECDEVGFGGDIRREIEGEIYSEEHDNADMETRSMRSKSEKDIERGL